MDVFHVAEKSNQDLKAKLIKAERERKSVAAALDNVERQVEGQWVFLCNAKDQLASSKEQIVALEKILEEVEKAKDQAEKARKEVEKAQEEAEQQGYDIGVAETKEALRAEVLGVCRTYCFQVWNEILNQAGVEVSFVLRKVESVYYPQAIRASSSSSSKANTFPKVTDPKKSNISQVPPPLVALHKWPSSLGRIEKRLR